MNPGNSHGAAVGGRPNQGHNLLAWLHTERVAAVQEGVVVSVALPTQATGEAEQQVLVAEVATQGPGWLLES